MARPRFERVSVSLRSESWKRPTQEKLQQCYGDSVFFLFFAWLELVSCDYPGRVYAEAFGCCYTVQFNISGEPPKALKMIDVQSAGRYNCVGHRLNASYGAMLQKRC